MLNAGSNNFYVCKCFAYALSLLIAVTALPFMKGGFADVMLIAERLYCHT